MKTRLAHALAHAATLAALLAATAACGRSSDSDEPAAGSAATPATEAKDLETEPGEDGGDAPPKRAALTPAKLAPVIQPLGVPGAVPQSIVIDLGTPIVERGATNSHAGETVVKLTPELRGTTTYSSVSGITFTPAQPFAFDTTYEVELVKVATRDGVLTPPSGTRWKQSFKTPPFKVLGWRPVQLEPGKPLVTMALSLTGPVLAHLALRSIEVTVNGKKPAGVGLARSYEPSTIALIVSDPAVAPGAKVDLAITRDLIGIADGKIAPQQLSATIPTDKALAIYSAGVVEGGTGFFVEVVCTDLAAPAGHRSSYSFGVGVSQLSQRCQLSDDALGKLTFEPPLKKVSITGGPAGFRIFGDFQRGVYTMKLDAGATTVDGGVLHAPFARSFVVPLRKPQVAFAGSGRYLPRTAWNNLAIRHQNVDAVNLFVRQIPADNLVFWLGGPDAADERTADLLLRKTVPLRAASDAPSTTWLDVASLLPATTKGVLEMKLVGLGASATARLMLTNMSLVAKKTSTPEKPWEQQVQVWALGMDSNALLDGVDVSLVRRSGKVVAKCTTQGGRGCQLAVKPGADPDHGEPFAVIARKGDDLTYLRYEDLRATVAESNTSGLPYVAPDVPYRAAVYADRGVYRPGDRAHVVAIVRDAKDRAPDRALPVEAKLFDPRAKVARKLALTTNGSGVVAIDHAFPAFADTGHWRLQLTVGDKPLASYSLQVEEFVPERMRVTAVPKRAQVLAGEKVAFDVSASYLFGGSAIDSGVELTCAVEPVRFAPKENADLVYGVEPKGRSVTLGENRDQLDPRGNVTIECPEAPAGGAFTQTARLTATAAVLEAGSGRATVRTANATLHPEKFYIGLRTKATRASAGEPFTVEGMIVDWEGRPVAQAPAKLDLELVHLEADYGYGYDEASGDSRYDRWLRAITEGKQEVAVAGGKFSFTVTPGAAPAGYVVRAKAGKARTELVLDGESPYEYYGYGEGDRGDQTPRPTRPTQLALDLPQTVKVGEDVAVKVKTPYRGKVLFTVETDRIVASEWRDATGAEATWKFKLAAFAPNVYVTAFLIKDPHLESKDAFLPDRAFGVQSARVAPLEFTQDVKIDAPKELRSSAKFSVTLDVGAGAGATHATVAVVDEGILSLTNFATPDPLAQLFARRALGVETYETIGWTMLHQPAGASSRTGGGDDGDGEGEGGGGGGRDRVRPVKPVALFSGVVPIGNDGKVSIPFELPPFRGQLRVMAITAGASKIGRAEARVLVRDPLVVQTTLPRFVTQGDELQVPVFLTNMSGGPLEVSVEMTSAPLPINGIAVAKDAPPPFTVTGKAAGAVKLDDGRVETLVFGLRAAMPIGGAKVRVIATAKGRGGGQLVFTDELDVPFLPAGPRERATTKLKVKAGAQDLTQVAALRGWVPTSETTRFWLTPNPYGESFEHLKHVVHYPYGCLEQTTSATRPLLYVGELAERIDPDLAGASGQARIEDMILAGINRVLSMETPSGGLGYWPGATEPEEWATAYATHMLLDAKRAGYAVPDDRLNGILAWIEGRVTLREQNRRIHPNRWGRYDEQAEAYLHYVLAAAGKGRKARISTLIAGIPPAAKGELGEGLYMLKAALYLAGDRRYERDLKAVDASPIVDNRSNGWSFYSDRRARAFMLSTFFDLFGNDPAGEPLAQRVALGLTGQSSYYYNTQEIVWGVTGLGKWVKALVAKGGAAAGTLTVGGVAVEPRKARGPATDRVWTVAGAADAKALALDVPASADGMWLVVASEGVRPAGEYKVGGTGLKVSRTYRTFDGAEPALESGNLKLGDVLFVEVTIANTSGAPVQNIALVDRLPGGFEIENSRLGRSATPSWVDATEAWASDFMNMRDDRIEVFGSLAPNQTKKVVYAVRAVTSGTFALPPVEAEAMYDPAIWARAKGGTAVVGGPWTGKTL